MNVTPSSVVINDPLPPVVTPDGDSGFEEGEAADAPLALLLSFECLWTRVTGRTTASTMTTTAMAPASVSNSQRRRWGRGGTGPPPTIFSSDAPIDKKGRDTSGVAGAANELRALSCNEGDPSPRKRSVSGATGGEEGLPSCGLCRSSGYARSLSSEAISTAHEA